MMDMDGAGLTKSVSTKAGITKRHVNKLNNTKKEFVKLGWRKAFLNIKFKSQKTQTQILDYINQELTITEIIRILAHDWFNRCTSYTELYDKLYHTGFRKTMASELDDVFTPMLNTSYSWPQMLDIALEYLQGRYAPIGPPGMQFPTEQEQPNTSHIPLTIDDALKVQSAQDNIHARYLKRFHSDKLLYHCTNWRGARSILKWGVDRTKSRPCLDFGINPSFYVTDDLQNAMNWGKKRNKNWHHEVCIVVFRTPTNPLSTMKWKIFDTPDKEWKDLVQDSRWCESDMNILDRMDFVSGPMCANPMNVQKRIETPKAHQRRVLYQLATKSDHSDRMLTDNIVHVMYFQKQIKNIT